MSKVLITRTSSGIGFETAIALSRPVTASSPRCGTLNEALRFWPLSRTNNCRLAILKMDIDSDESVDAATSAIAAQTGCIDVLVNIAGIEPFPTKRGMARRQRLRPRCRFQATTGRRRFGVSDARQRVSHLSEVDAAEHGSCKGEDHGQNTRTTYFYHERRP